jgi:PAS domain S-box-containing protein
MISNFKIGFIAKISILIGVIEIIAFSLFTYIYITKYTTYVIKEDMHKSLSTINKLIANDEMPISSLSRKSYMSEMIGRKYLDGFIVGNNGFIIVSSNLQYLGKKIDVIKDFNSAFITNVIGEKFIFNDNDNTLTSVSYIPKKSSLSPLYHVIIKVSTKELQDEISDIIKFSIIISLAFIFITTLSIILFAQRFVAKRVDESLDVLKQAETGDLDARIKVTNKDEIGQLQIGINSMIEEVSSLLNKYKKSLDDISIEQHKTLEQKEKLKELNSRFELTLDAVEDGIWDWNIKTDKAYFSKRWKSMLGYDEDDIINEGKVFFDLIHDEDKEAVKEAINKHFADPTNNHFNIEVRLKSKSGEYKWILSRGKVILDEDGKPSRMLGYHSDITHDKQQEKIILEQSKNAAMGEMIGNIAHQWRQPLSVISTAATGLKLQKEYGKLTDELFINSCDAIDKNAQYLSKTIDDFKNFIKGDRKETKINILNTVNSFLSLVEGSIKNNNINVNIDIKDDINTLGYPNELIQCFMNIYNNSKDALKTKEDKKLIFISSKIEKDKVIIIFKDNAGGIPSSILPKIFEPYFTTKHQSQGTGLGLSMTYKLIVDGMSGTIEADNIKYTYENQEYIGAKFTIKLPFKN